MIARACALALSVLLAASAASAQVIRRDQPQKDAAKDGAKAAGDASAPADDDDDILAPTPAGKPADKKPEPPPPAARAADAPKVGLVSLVPVGDASKVTADQVTAALLKELASSRALDASPLAVDAGGVSAQKSAEDEAAARAALADGLDKLQKGQGFLAKNVPGKAKAAFELALASLERAAPVLDNADPLFDAHVGLAQVAGMQANEDEVAAQLTAASAYNPEREIAPGPQAPAQFIRTHQKLREKLMKEARGTVVVDASGAGAAVTLDGRDTAGAPVRLLEVPAGKHLVRALREGLPAWGTIVDVPAGGEVVVSPGFLAKDGKSWFDALAQNRFDAGAVEQVKKAAAAAGLKGALVGVVGRKGGLVPVQLLYVDAAGAGVAALPEVSFQGDLLDVSIESLKARERAEELAQATGKAPLGTYSASLDTVLAGAQAGKAAKVAEVKMRYDFKAAPAERKASRVMGSEDKGDEEGGRSVLSGGKSGTRQRLEDEDDPYRERKGRAIEDPDAPITDQPWFWPVVIGGAAGVVVLAGGVTVLALIGLKVIPDPRPADKGEVHVTLP